MFNKGILAAIGVITVLAILALAAFAGYPSLVQLRPEYKEAAAICDGVKAGMTFEEVENKVGYLFFSEPMTYIDNEGNGQAQLRNNVKGLDATCVINFEKSKVIWSAMSYVWL